jgi:hypothetical protein
MRLRFVLLGSFSIAFTIWMARAASNLGPIRFQDVTANSKINFVLRNGAKGAFHQVELMPGGVGVIDYDNDGCMDIYFTNLAESNRLYRNNCAGVFTDVTAHAGVAAAGGSMGVAVADYDNDGYPDIFVAGVTRNILYHNRRDGTFEDVTGKAGLGGAGPAGKPWSIAAGWFDADKDGHLDLFVSNYVSWNPNREPACGSPQFRQYCHPDMYAGLPNQYFHNQGDGTFTDLSASSGIAASIGKGMGVAFADFNRDGLTDVIVANDSVRNFLFKNLGGNEFREVGLESGVSLGDSGRPIAGMGVDFRDYDNDGLPDVVMTGMINDSYLLFRNVGSPAFFEDRSNQSGLTRATRQLTGWGMGLYDFDNDGFKDLFFANSHFPSMEHLLGVATPLTNTVLRNTGSGQFTPAASLGPPAYYRGVGFADFDNDGRVDAVVSSLGEGARLYRNITMPAGHWLALRLQGKRSNRDGLGAEVTVTLPDKKRLFNQATTSVGYASSSEPLVRFGTGEFATVPEISVRWPSGATQKLSGVNTDRVLEVREP